LQGKAVRKRGEGVEAVDRALKILSAFEAGRARLTLAELAARTGLYKSTILRLAHSLEAGGFLHREANGAFGLGAEPLRLAAVYRRGSDLEAKVRPVLKTLLDETGESASFFRREGDRRLCLFREETQRAIRDHVMEGDMLPMDIGAAGRVLARFDGLTAADAGTEPHDVSMGERDPETAALAAPVFAEAGLAGALTISGPRARLTPERLAEIAPQVVAQARRLTALLGGGR
jgi:DNA-binding IclR family transcriptional regulator